MVRVWFNHWFSTSYRLIELMKQDREEEIYVIGSNREKNAVIQLVCDEWYQEPDIDGEAYIEYCLNFCREHHVNVFVPRRKMVDISKNRKGFEELGVRLMVDSYDKIQILNDKVKTYRMFQGDSFVRVPDYDLVNTAETFEGAYKRQKEKYDRLCIKFVQDEGGMSFRKITEHVDPWKRLRGYPGAEIVFEELLETLKEVERFDDMMIMPYLPGNEISVDCLNTEKGLIAVPRVKGAARHEKIEYDSKILEMTKRIMDRIQLEYPCNIQFKERNGFFYLLEINTRMSGGLQMSCLAAEVNIPNIALNKVLGKTVDWTMSTVEKTVSYIEIPKIVSID